MDVGQLCQRQVDILGLFGVVERVVLFRQVGENRCGSCFWDTWEVMRGGMRGRLDSGQLGMYGNVFEISEVLGVFGRGGRSIFWGFWVLFYFVQDVVDLGEFGSFIWVFLLVVKYQSVQGSGVVFGGRQSEVIFYGFYYLGQGGGGWVYGRFQVFRTYIYFILRKIQVVVRQDQK